MDGAGDADYDFETAVHAARRAYEASNARHEEQIAMLRRELASKEDDIAALQNQVRASQLETSNAQNHIDRLVAEQSQMMADNLEQNQQLNALRQELSKLKAFKKAIVETMAHETTATANTSFVNASLASSFRAPSLTSSPVLPRRKYADSPQRVRHGNGSFSGGGSVGMETPPPMVTRSPVIARASNRTAGGSGAGARTWKSPSEGTDALLAQIDRSIGSSNVGPSVQAGDTAGTSVQDALSQLSQRLDAARRTSQASARSSYPSSPAAARPMPTAASAPVAAASPGHSARAATTASTPSPRGSALEGKEFFQAVRERLGSDQFAQFLAAIKDMNTRARSREETMVVLERVFGPSNQDLLQRFKSLLLA